METYCVASHDFERRIMQYNTMQQKRKRKTPQKKKKKINADRSLARACCHAVMTVIVIIRLRLPVLAVRYVIYARDPTPTQ